MKQDNLIWKNHTCNLVFITSAGVTSAAAGIPAIAPDTNNDRGLL